MQNLPAISSSTLPAYLTNGVGKNLAVSADALVGLSTGAPLRIVANQGRFRIKDGSDESVLDSLYLDMTVVGAVTGTTKVFYATAYNPKDDKANKEPDCASLYGDAPDAGVPAPQAASCAICPKNQWGSKISEAGTELKACSDHRRLAIISPDDPETLYQFNIPPASLKDWGKYVKDLTNRGVDLSVVVTRVSLDDHKLVFNFAGFITEEVYTTVQGLLGSAEVDTVLGKFGRQPVKPALPAPAAAAPAPTPAPTPQAAPAPVAAPAPAPEATTKRGFGKKAGAAPTATPAPAAAPAAVVAPASAGLESLAAELGNLIGGAPSV